METTLKTRDANQDYLLPAGRLMRIQRARGWTLYCEYGELLATQADDARDYVLRAGERMALHTRGKVLIEAAEGAGFRLLEPRRTVAPGYPVVRLLAPRPHRLPGRPVPSRGFLDYETFSRNPRLLEALLRDARRERNAAVAAFAVGCATGLGNGLQALVGGAVKLLRALRPRLPSVQETCAALVFLRSRC